MVDPLGVIGVVGVVYDIAKDIYALHQRHQSNKRELEGLANFVKNTGSYVERLIERQALYGIEYVPALESLSNAFETTRKQLIDLKTELRHGWLDSHIYRRIQDIDAELQKGFNASLLLVAVELGQSPAAKAVAIERSLSEIIHAVNRIEQNQHEPKLELHRLACSFKDITNLKVSLAALNGEHFEPWPEEDMIARLDVCASEVDKRISIEPDILENAGDDLPLRHGAIKPEHPASSATRMEQISGFVSSASQSMISIGKEFKQLILAVEQKAKFWKKRIEHKDSHQPFHFFTSGRSLTDHFHWLKGYDFFSRAAKAMFNRQIQLDARKLHREIRLLVLGSRNSGKSTIIKRMKIDYEGFTTEELLAYRPIICKHVLEKAKAIIKAMRTLGFDCINPANQLLADKIEAYQEDMAPSFLFSQEIATAIHELFEDPVIRKVVKHQHEFRLMDDTTYFLEEMLRIGDPSYIPTEIDVLQVKTTESMDIHLMMGQLLMHIIEVDNRLFKCRKLLHCFEGVTTLIFCVALSDYDQMNEDNTQNQIAKNLLLFEGVINAELFRQASVFLLFTKFDVFHCKLSNVPMERYFPDYSGGSDTNTAADYILSKFLQANRAHRIIYPIFTWATDKSVIRLVFAAVKDTILHNALKG